MGVAMVFGMKGLGGDDSGVEAQRQHLARTETALVNVEQGIARLPGYKAQFADAWFDSPEVAEAIERVPPSPRDPGSDQGAGCCGLAG